MKEINPCSTCGSGEVGTYVTCADNMYIMFISCNRCGKRGKARSLDPMTKEILIEEWNKS